jgi:hypothetical protein
MNDEWARPDSSPTRDSDAPGGGLTCKMHLAGEGGRRPLSFVITPGQWGDAQNLAARRSKTSGTAPLCAITVLPNQVV